MGDNGQDVPVVSMEGITKRFGTITALDNVNFTVSKHEVVGLLGDNGAGKSTLIKVLTGVHPPSGGQIYFEGKPVDNPLAARRAGAGHRDLLPGPGPGAADEHHPQLLPGPRADDAASARCGGSTCAGWTARRARR